MEKKELPKKTVVNNVICSVKGGCGKTTTALRLALSLDFEFHEKEGSFVNLNSRNVCVIDMDIQGTAMEHLLFGINSESGDYESKNKDDLTKCRRAPINLNEKTQFTKADDTKDFTDYVSYFCWGDNLDANTPYKRGFDVVLAGADEKTKNNYRSDATVNYIPAIQHGAFREGIKNMLSANELFTVREEPYEFVFFDMPPNNDNYSDVIFSCLLDKGHMPNKKCTGSSKKFLLSYVNNLFIVMTQDFSQHKVSIDYLNTILSQENNNFDAIFIVVNYLYYNKNDENPEDREAVIRHIIELINKSNNIISRKKDIIHILEIGFCEFYFKQCCVTDGISNFNDDNAKSKEKLKGCIMKMSNVLSDCVIYDLKTEEYKSYNDKYKVGELLGHPDYIEEK